MPNLNVLSGQSTQSSREGGAIITMVGQLRSEPALVDRDLLRTGLTACAP